ncbi:MAG: amino acid adenylation domain-containing protein [Thiohalomonadales bacterium]
MTGIPVDIKNDYPLIVQVNNSEDRAKTLVLDWLPVGAVTSEKDICVYTDDKSDQLVDSINALNLSSSFTATLIGFFATVLYRYSYQSEFEIQYTQVAGDKSIEINNPLKFLSFNFLEHTQLTAAKTSYYVSEILSSVDLNSLTTRPSYQSAFCVVELNQNYDEALNILYAACVNYQGRIWPLIEKTEDSYKLRWLFDRRLSVDIIKTLQAHIQSLINQSSKQLDTPLSRQVMLTEEEYQQQIAFSSGVLCDDEALPIYKLIENHALAQPDEVAVVYQQTKLTYAQLNSQANDLAYTLLARKVEHCSVVAVFLTPSANILVSILAIHKLGGIYVPIDPNFPATRISAILNEVNPVVILCDEQTDGILTKHSSICLKISEVESSINSVSNPDITVALEDVSHIYFTSGTTGKPKGVMATQQNLIHYISSAINRYKFNKNDSFLAGARFTFSISMFELMIPLVAGACVRILPRETILDLSQLSKAVASATVFHFGPSLLKQLLPYIEQNYDSFEPFDQLRHVSSGGDMVPPEILEKLKKIFRNAEVFVIYGSSEINCMGCTYEVPRDKTITKTLIGSPHQNVKVRIFDRDSNMVPIGVPGQIFFGGKGLIKGYLNLPALTQEKFTIIDGERFYAIGDIGRFDQDGNIELLGREDFQVQIRGMRIELLEVEACLKSYSGITDCVVVARSLQENEEKSLIAYLVFQNGEKIIAKDINSFVADKLPDYMVPALFVKLDKLPVNHNAKLDRSQLPLPSSENIIISAEYQTASNDVEKELISIWEDLFNISNIGVDHNFFELGGDSLLAVNFLIEVDNIFNKFIPISIMVDAPTIRDIAKILASDKPIGGVGDVVVLRKGNSEPPLFCLYGVFLYKDLAASLDTERMVCGVYLEEEVSLMHKGRDSEEFKVFSSVENIATRYLKSIRAFQPNGPYYLCGESFGGIAALEVARKLQQEGESVQLLAMFDSAAPGYKESLSRINRIAIHLRLIIRLGWPYLKQKISMYLKHIGVSSMISKHPVPRVEDIRGEARDLAIKNYLPEPYQSKVILFTAQERTDFDSGFEDLGWGKFIQELEIHEINGDHLEILEHGQVEKMANILLKNME